MAESDNILTKLHDLLVYLIPQLNRFPRDQKFVLGDRIETKLLDVQEDCLGAYYVEGSELMRLYYFVDPGGRMVMTLVHGSQGAYSMYTRWLITLAHFSCLTFSV
jgi:hypothetical protein